MTLGKKLHELRRQHGMTQDAVAERLGVSPQAVSKWENDFSCPDIMMLPKIAMLYGITIDDLFQSDTFDPKPPVRIPPEKEETAEELDNLYLNVYVNTKVGDDVKVHVPFKLVKELVNAGMNISGLFGTDLSGVDIESIFAVIQDGALGEIATVTTQNGDLVRVVVEP